MEITANASTVHISQSRLESLKRAVHGQSFSNFPAIFQGFAAKGIPESEIKPRENVFTFQAWKALGRVVRRGEHGVKVATFMGTDRPHVLRQAIHCCRNFGTVSIVGVYGGLLDNIPMGSAINRGLTFRMAQTPVQHYLPQLLERIEKGQIDPSFVITHRATLEEGPELYKTFRAKQDGCIKVVMKP